MGNPKEGIFREESLERLSSPDRLDELLRVVRRRNWIPLLVLAGLLAAGVAWSVLGRVPLSANGLAILIHPRQVVPVQCPATGQLVALEARVGDRVLKGQVLGSLNLPDLEKQLEQERSRLVSFRARDSALSSFEAEQAKAEKAHLAKERGLIEARIGKLTRMATDLRTRNLAYNDQQRKNLTTAYDLLKELGASLAERLERYQALRNDSLSSEEEVLAVRSRMIENRLQVADLEVKMQELQLREIQTEESWSKQMDLVADLDLTLLGLEEKEAAIDRRLLEAELSSSGTVQEIERTIARLRARLDAEGRIVSEYDGRILEITASAGSIVSAGQRIGTMEAEDPASPLMVLAYFNVADGKKIKAGMGARVSPVTVQREKDGSAIGTVAAVSDYPVTTEAAANQIGNREMAQALVQGGSQIEVLVSLSPAPATPSGYRWTSAGGPDIELTAGTTASIRVTIEERAPITFILPVLKAWFGVE